MSLLAETLVDEWMNRNGFFTVRGLKSGVHEIDLLGVRPIFRGLEAWHVEVQVSFRPIGYIAPLTKSLTGFAKSRTSVKHRPPDVLKACVDAWLEKKFKGKTKWEMRERAWPNLNWKFLLVHGRLRHPEEGTVIESSGITMVSFGRLLRDLDHVEGAQRGGAGTDIAEIVEFFHQFQAGET